ncbi:MAG TPA: hypothetical protein VFM09_06525 [Marmoricola sp.]|nr:hypothetical protein [Marmoricola sp.]
MGYDFVTWGAVAIALTALGGMLSWRAWRRRGAAAGLRGLAWSILPVAAWLTGTLRLAAQVAGDVADWAVRLVFSPVVWLGVALAGVAVALFVVSGAMRARGRGVRSRPTGTPPAAGLPGQRRGGASLEQKSGQKSGQDSGLEDMDDIEAILRKHGIS